LEFSPHASLLVPVQRSRQRSQMAQLDRVPATRDRAPEENLFLDAGSEREQAHDLGDPRPADMAEPGQFGIVRNGASAEEWVEAQCQGQQTGDARQPSGYPARFVLAGAHQQAPAVAALDMQGTLAAD